MTDTTIRALEACKTLKEAKELAAGMRKTAIAVEAAHGPDDRNTKVFQKRYDTFVDEMAYRYNAGLLST